MRLLRHILGFVVGLGLFGVAVPLGIFYLTQAIDHSLGLERFGPPVLRVVLGLPFLLLGLLFVLWSNIFLVVRGRGGPTDGFGVVISPRTEKLVVTGPYRYTRNPMVFGAFSAYLSMVLSSVCLLPQARGGGAACQRLRGGLSGVPKEGVHDHPAITESPMRGDGFPPAAVLKQPVVCPDPTEYDREGGFSEGGCHGSGSRKRDRAAEGRPNGRHEAGYGELHELQTVRG
jgi:hypothetical protein